MFLSFVALHIIAVVFLLNMLILLSVYVRRPTFIYYYAPTPNATFVHILHFCLIFFAL